MKKIIKWLESNVISITLIAFLAGIAVLLINIAFDHVIVVYIYLVIFGIAIIGTMLQLIWAWIVNPIRAYRKKKI